MTATATTVSIDGVKTPLVFGARFRVRYGAGLILEDARLVSRSANGDLIFAPVGETGDLGTVRIRPRSIAAIFGSGVAELAPKREIVRRGLGDILAGTATAASVLDELRLDGSPEPSYQVDAAPIIPDFQDGETGDAYLARLERTMGSSWHRWVGTETGQAALEAATARTRAERKPVRKLELDEAGEIRIPEPAPKPTRTGRYSAGRKATAAVLAAPIHPSRVTTGAAPYFMTGVEPKLTTAGRRKLVEAGADPVAVANATTASDVATVLRRDGQPVKHPEHNFIWRCATCKARTRKAECVGRPGSAHELVSAPAGARAADRVR